MFKRLSLLIIWTVILGYFACSVNPFVPHLSQFHVVRHAKPTDLLIMDIKLTHPSWWFSKIGHFVGFFIFDLLIFNLLRRAKLAATIAILFGISTEILQLYFSRDGRLYDMIIDSLGVALSYTVQARFNQTSHKHPADR